MRHRRNRWSAVVATMAMVVALVPVFAVPAAAVSGPEPVATGLDAPWKLAEGPDGTMYVAEGGVGGDVCTMVVGPDGDEVEACAGASGAVTAFDADGQSRVATGLPSVQLGTEPIGPQGIAFDSLGRLHVVTGLGGDAAARAGYEQDALGSLIRISSSGEATVVADLVEWEEANDPDAGLPGVTGPDSNPYGLAFDGTDALVADAGGNSLVRVTANGSASLEALFPPTFVEPPPFIPAPGQIPMQAVPTTVEVTAGQILVGQLTGFPFPVGGASIYDVSSGTPTAALTGFTNVIDMAIADDGTIYVLEFASTSLLDPAGPQAALVQVRTDGTRKVLLYGAELPVPGGVAVGSDGMVYVSVCTLCGPGQGMVWKVDPSVASDAATAAACDPDAVPGSGFADIASSTHRDAIHCAAWWGIVNGLSATAYGPADAITRGQVAAMIARTLVAAGFDIGGEADAFSDDDGSVHEGDINALAAIGIITGRADGTVDADANVSRAEVASLLARTYAAATGDELAAGTDAFTDDDGSGHEADIDAVAAAGWVNGIGGGLFDPNGAATRAQFASMITRMLSTLVDDGVVAPPA